MKEGRAGREVKIEAVLTLDSPWREELRTILSQWVDCECTYPETVSLLNDLNQRIRQHGLALPRPWTGLSWETMRRAHNDIVAAKEVILQDVRNQRVSPQERLEAISQTFPKIRQRVHGHGLPVAVLPHPCLLALTLKLAG